jgi:uncharacterized protein (TIGR03083 family)
VTSDRRVQRDQLVTAYRAALDGLLAATTDLDDAAWRAPTGCPGWDVHDQLAHSVGLERRLLGDPDPDPDVVVPDLPHLTGDVGRYLERDVEARRQVPHEDLLAEAHETFGRRREALDELAPEQLDEQTMSLMGPMRTAPALRMRLFDLASHERDIRAAVGRLDGFAGEHLPVVVEQAVRSWARTLPTRIDDGDTVTFVVDEVGTYNLDLGTGLLSSGAGAGPPARSASVRLTVADTLALAGGRDDAPSLEDLEHEGDGALLARVIAATGVTP